MKGWRHKTGPTVTPSPCPAHRTCERRLPAASHQSGQGAKNAACDCNDRQVQPQGQPSCQALLRIQASISGIANQEHRRAREQARACRQEQRDPASELWQHPPDQPDGRLSAVSQRRSPVNTPEKRRDRRRIRGHGERGALRDDGIAKRPQSHSSGNERQQPGGAEDACPGRRGGHRRGKHERRFFRQA